MDSQGKELDMKPLDILLNDRLRLHPSIQNSIDISIEIYIKKDAKYFWESWEKTWLLIRLYDYELYGNVKFGENNYINWLKNCSQNYAHAYDKKIPYIKNLIGNYILLYEKRENN